MKNDYTDDEYKSLVNINIPDEELPSKKKTTVSRAEVERRKKLAAEANENKRRTAALAFFAVALILIVCVTVAAVSVSVKKSVARRDAALKQEPVITVAGEEIGADVFRMFCANVIEGQDFENMLKTSIDDGALCTAVKEKAVDYIEEYVCLSGEAGKAGISLSAEELNNLRHECEQAGGSDREKYYRENYGISFEDYFKIRSGWLLAEKYAAKLRMECDISETRLAEVYEANYRRFAKAEVTMVYFDTSSADEGANGFKRSNAETVFKSICLPSGSETASEGETAGEENDGFVTADETALREAVRGWSDRNVFFDISAADVSGSCEVTGDDYAKFPVLYETVLKMRPGEVRLINDKAATFIVRCDRLYLFESLRTSDELIRFTQDLYIKDVYTKARNSGEYEARLSTSYRTLDISQFVTEGKKYYGS